MGSFFVFMYYICYNYKQINKWRCFMNKEYISPIIEIIEFDECICTYNEDGELEYYGNVQESSGGWLPWI